VDIFKYRVCDVGWAPSWYRIPLGWNFHNYVVV
jgi:hypothetical protein